MKKLLLAVAVMALIGMGAVAVKAITVNPAASVTGDSEATADTVVYRDDSGDFKAHNITANSFIGPAVAVGVGVNKIAVGSSTGSLVGYSTFTITSAGLVGIGTTNPTANVHISPALAQQNTNAFQVGSTTFTILRSGNVGIGTTSPAQTLSVVSVATAAVFQGWGPLSGASSHNGVITLGDSSYNGRIYMDSNGSVVHMGMDNFYDSATNTGIRFRNRVGGATPVENLFLSSNGNAGIGTTNPSQALDVTGKGVFSTNVGIGTTNPLAEVHIQNATPDIMFTTGTVTGVGSNEGQADILYGAGFTSFSGRTDRFQIRADLAGSADTRWPLSLSGKGIEFASTGDQGNTQTVTITTTGGFKPYMRTKAQLEAIVPTVVGEVFSCSDCSNNVNAVISSGTSVCQFNSWGIKGTAWH